MNKAFKGGNVLWITILIIGLLCMVSLLFFMLQERAKRIGTEQRLSESEKAKRAVEIKLDHAQLELIQLKDEARILAGQLVQEKEGYLIALEKIDKKDNQIEELESNLTNEKKQRTSLANTLAQLRENYDSLEERLKEAKLEAEEYQKQLGKFGRKTGVKLKKIVVKPSRELEGKVLVVNNEFHFVVIDLGKKDGVNVGNKLVIYQGSEEIGRVQVEKVYDAMSTASILPGSQEHKISEDSVVKSF